MYNTDESSGEVHINQAFCSVQVLACYLHQGRDLSFMTLDAGMLRARGGVYALLY